MDRTDVLIPNDVRQIGYRCTHHFWEYNGLFQSSKFKSWAHKYMADNVHLHKQRNFHFYTSRILPRRR